MRCQHGAGQPDGHQQDAGYLTFANGTRLLGEEKLGLQYRPDGDAVVQENVNTSSGPHDARCQQHATAEIGRRREQQQTTKTTTLVVIFVVYLQVPFHLLPFRPPGQQSRGCHGESIGQGAKQQPASPERIVVVQTERIHQDRLQDTTGHVQRTTDPRHPHHHHNAVVT